MKTALSKEKKVNENCSMIFLFLGVYYDLVHLFFLQELVHLIKKNIMNLLYYNIYINSLLTLIAVPYIWILQILILILILIS